jgi:hypothetical protein
MVGAVELQRWGAVVLDGPHERIWVKKDRSSGSPAPLYQATALAWNDLGSSAFSMAQTAETAEQNALSVCNHQNGHCRIAIRAASTGFFCLALAHNDRITAR